VLFANAGIAIRHMKLDGLCGLVAAQLGRQPPAAVDPGRDAGSEDPISVDDHPFVDRDRTKERQQVKRSPVRRRRRPLSRPAAPQSRAPVHTEKRCAPAACWRIQASASASSINASWAKAARHMKDEGGRGASGVNRNPFRSRTVSAVLA